MSNVDLILLGFLMEKPQSAYDIQKQIKFRNLSNWVKISKAAIFKNALVLEKKGYVTSETVREGNMPEKTIYSITPEGRIYFKELVEKTADAPVSVLFEFNTVITSLNKIPRQEALKHIETIRLNMMASRDFIKETEPFRQQIPLVGRAIMQQQIEVLNTLIQWIEGFEKDFMAENEPESKSNNSQQIKRSGGNTDENIT